MSRTGANIYKRKDGRWEGRYIKAYDENGKRRLGYVYSKSYSEAKIKLNMAIAESQKHPIQRSLPILFSEVAKEWLERVKLHCKESTYNKYSNTYHKIIAPRLGSYPIAKISSQMIDLFMERLLTTGKSDGTAYSHKSVQEIGTVIKQIVKYAEESYQIKVQFSVKQFAVKPTPTPISLLTRSEAQALTRFLIEEPDNCKTGVLLCLYTGIRLGELCALQWGDISLSEGTVNVSKTAQRIQQLGNSDQKTKLIISTPKSTCSHRTIPLPPFLIQILRERQRSQECYILSGETECMEPKTLQNRFKEYLSLCNLPAIHFHALRHTFATRCIELGFDAKTLSEILGHSSVNITLNRYVHSSSELKKKSMCLFENEYALSV